MSGKVMVSNLSALKAKYGSSRRQQVVDAVKALAAADKARGLKTMLVDVSDAAAMKRVNGKPVANAASMQQNKSAVDAIYRAYTPDYLVLVGAPDVIPHLSLQNPTGDEDSSVPSDLPYACEAPYGRHAESFVGPTRVVGRLPDLTGARDPAYLLAVLKAATDWQSGPASDYAAYFGLSARVWADSTTLSLTKLFGPGAVPNLSPPKGPQWTTAELGVRSHFINCHGAPDDPHYYGQQGEDYPIADDAAWVNGKIVPGTVAAVECCYGAQLYDPAADPGKQMGIAATYLGNAAYGFFGSTTIAYGPAAGNGSADLLCQYFLKRVLTGASLGRAVLEARQEFAQGASALDPMDLKTLAQFNLLGDPSIQPVQKPPTHVMAAGKGLPGLAAEQKNEVAARADRRRALFAKGLIIAHTQPVAQLEEKPARSPKIESALRRLAREHGLGKAETFSYRVAAPAAGGLAKSRGLAAAPVGPVSAFHVALQKDAQVPGAAARYTALVAKEQNGELVSYRVLVSR